MTREAHKEKENQLQDKRSPVFYAGKQRNEWQLIWYKPEKAGC